MSTQDIKGKNLIYETRTPILEMIESRGYNIDNYKHFSKDEIIRQFEQSTNKVINSEEIGPLDILVENSNNEKIMVKYRLDEKFKKSKSLDQQINKIYDTILSKDDTLIIIIITRVLSIYKDSNVYQYCENIYKKKDYFVQIFGLENFIFNVSNNNIVPKHTILSKKEEEEMLQNQNITDKKQLPQILREDPQAKYIGLKPGQICHIDAVSFSSMKVSKWRLCIN